MSTWTEKDQRLFEQMRDGGRRRARPREVAHPEAPALEVRTEIRADLRPVEGTVARPRTIRSRLLEERTLDELYLRARELDIAGRSRMTKDELVAAIRAAN